MAPGMGRKWQSCYQPRQKEELKVSHPGVRKRKPNAESLGDIQGGKRGCARDAWSGNLQVVTSKWKELLRRVITELG